MRPLFYFLILFFLSVSALGNNTTHIQIQSSISPATMTYLEEATAYAKKHNSQFIVIELDTPGGLATSMRDMIQVILNSPIPIVTYVSPKGSRAASAGTFLMYASHVAVMAPGTNIGAATPVNLMQPPKQQEDKKKETTPSAMEKKVMNDSIAYIKSLAQLRNKDESFAIAAVKEGKSLSAKEALEQNVIDFMAFDLTDLIKQLHNRMITMGNEVKTLNTIALDIKTLEPSLKTQFLMVISNANIAYIFLLLAIYGILFEMMNPGAVVPGVVGAISAFIALYALNILPFNYVGLLLIILGVAFMVAEVFIAGIGIVGMGGVIAFVIGSFMLFDEKVIGTAISEPLIFAIAIVSFAFFMYLVRSLMRARKEKSKIGLHQLEGKKAIVTQVFSHGYKVALENEVWDASSQEELKKNDEVEIISTNGLHLHVRRVK